MLKNTSSQNGSVVDVSGVEEDVISHKGIHVRRFAVLDCQAAHREAAFADLWEQMQESHTLEYLLGQNNARHSISHRDALVAATVVQWLGTPVGNDFMKKALANANASIREQGEKK